MEAAVDITALARSSATGIENYVLHLCRHLPAADPETEYRLFATSWGHYRRLQDVAEELRAQNSRPVVRRAPRSLVERLQRSWNWPKVEDLAGPVDIIHVNDTMPPPRRRARLVATVFDLIPQRMPDVFSSEEARLKVLARIQAAVSEADLVITISKAAEADLLEEFPETRGRTAVTHLAADERFRPVHGRERLAAVREKYGIDRGYLLYVGSRLIRKNLPGLVRAFAALPSNVREELCLVLAGRPGPADRELLPLIDRLGLGGRVLLLGYVEDADLPALLSGAEAFAFPSFYEGFGIPVMEALACGAPVITSDRSSLPEIAGDAALLVDPADTDGLSSAIARVLEDSDLRRGLQERALARAGQFTWDATAEKTARLYRSVLPGG